MKRFTALLALALGAPFAGAGPLAAQWSDPAGDASPVGDVVGAQLRWDAGSARTADAAHPFTDKARFNLNLFDTALGTLATATAPQLSLDATQAQVTGSVPEPSMPALLALGMGLLLFSRRR